MVTAPFLWIGCSAPPVADTAVPTPPGPRKDTASAPRLDTGDPDVDTASDMPCGFVEQRVEIGMVAPWYNPTNPWTAPWYAIVPGIPPNVFPDAWGGLDWRLYPRLYNFHGTAANYEMYIYDVPSNERIWSSVGGFQVDRATAEAPDRPCSIRERTLLVSPHVETLGGAVGDHPYPYLNGHEIFITLDVYGVDNDIDIANGPFHAETYGTASFPPPPP